MNALLSILALSAFLTQEKPLKPPDLTDTIDRAVPRIRGVRVKELPPSSSDREFLSRITLDLVGENISALDLKAFEEDPRSDKRLRKIDQLLSDPRYGDVWAKRFERVFFGDPAPLRLELLPDYELPILCGSRSCQPSLTMD